MIRILVLREQIACVGDIDASTRAVLADALSDVKENPADSEGASALRPGVVLVREHDGAMHRVMVLDHGYAWNGRVFASLSAVASAITGTIGMVDASLASTGRPEAMANACRKRRGPPRIQLAPRRKPRADGKLELGLVGKKD